MSKKLREKGKRKGFTLIELIIVIAILGSLMAIVVPRLTKFRESAVLSADRATAATIAKAAELYVLSENISENDKDKGKIDIKILEKNDYLEKETKPQNSKYKSFSLNYKNGMFIVTYEDEEKLLYPVDNKN